MKLKIGITGQGGFVGQHLFNTLGLFPEAFERVCFQRDFFEDELKLNDFVGKCDVIVHLAAMNRHGDLDLLYQINMSLVNKLIASLKQSRSRAHVLFASSLQEEQNNAYGRSKNEARELLANWAEKAGAIFTGLVIPNVFGSFGRPFHNSFIATFSHQLSHNQQPKIEIDGEVKLIYVAELISVIIDKIH
jgi:UDP-2-acetamido-2,6-beta-L-arabino-hexul-4-ose reductase